MKILSKLYFLIILVVVSLTTPIFGKIFEVIIGRDVNSGFYGPVHPEYIPGFFLSYVFFVSIYLFYQGDFRKKYLILLSLFFIVLMDLFFGAFQELIICAFAGLLGGLIGFGLRKIINTYIKREQIKR